MGRRTVWAAVIVVVLVGLVGFAIGRQSASPSHGLAASKAPSRAALIRMASTCIRLTNESVERANAKGQPESSGQMLAGTPTWPTTFKLTPAHVRAILQPCLGSSLASVRAYANSMGLQRFAAASPA
jgi:hypothetical protein